MLLFLFGMPGSGKGTQAAFLKKDYAFNHVSTGDLIRTIVKNKKSGWEMLSDIMKRGELVPDVVINDIFSSYILENGAEKNYIIDGYPRTLQQFELVKKSFGDKYKIVNLYMESKESVIFERITSRRVCRACGAIYNNRLDKDIKKCTLCGGEVYQRLDDTENILRKRLDEYKNKTLPVIEALRKQNKLYIVDGDRDPSNIFVDIQKILTSEGL